MNCVSEHKKGRQLRVVGGSKYPGKKGWVNISRGANGYTQKSVYIIYIDGGGNEVEAPSCIRMSSVKYEDWDPSAASAAKNQLKCVSEHKKGRQLRVVGGSKYPGKKGWVNISRGDNGYTPQSVYIIYIDGGGNEVEAPNCIRMSSVKYVDWDPSATSAAKNQLKRVSEHKKGRQLSVVGGSKYPGKKGWVNISRGDNGYTPQSVYIIYIDGGGNEVEAPNCIRMSSVKYVDWYTPDPTNGFDTPDDIISSSELFNDKDAIIQKLLQDNQKLERALWDEQDKIRRLEGKLEKRTHGMSSAHVQIKKENKAKEKMLRARLKRLVP